MSERDPLIQRFGRLPFGQLAVLGVTGFCSTLAFSTLFSYITFFVRDLGVPEQRVGYYVGNIEGLYSLVAALTIISWSNAADRFGQKLILIICLVGTTFATVAFGFSATLPQLFLLRALSGAFAGSVAIVRTMIAELSTPETSARAFSIYTFATNVSLLFGPAIGGFLCQPAIHFPNSIGRIGLLQKYPYALPGLVVGLANLIAIILVLLYLEEPERKSSKQDRSKSFWQYLDRKSVIALIAYELFVLHGASYSALMPLYLFTKVRWGGLGFDSQAIATFLSSLGALQAFWILFAMPKLDKKYGTTPMAQICFCMRPILYCLPVVANILMRNNHMIVCYVWLGFLAILGSASAMGYTFTQLLLNQSAPEGGLAALNALALSLVQVFRTVAPGVTTSIAAFSVQHNILHGYLAWLVLFLFGVASAAFTLMLPQARQHKKSTDAA